MLICSNSSCGLASLLMEGNAVDRFVHDSDLVPLHSHKHSLKAMGIFEQGFLED